MTCFLLKKQFHNISWDRLGFKGRTSFKEGIELQLSIISRTHEPISRFNFFFMNNQIDEFHIFRDPSQVFFTDNEKKIENKLNKIRIIKSNKKDNFRRTNSKCNIFVRKDTLRVMSFFP